MLLSDIAGEEGKKRIRQLIESYFQKGGFHLQFNIVDTHQLEQAKATPHENHGLIVRIGGYSDYFNKLGDNIKQEMSQRKDYST